MSPRFFIHAKACFMHTVGTCFWSSISRRSRTWLQSCIAHVFKKGLTCDPNNYRPIALTCIACRDMEKIIRHAIMKYLYIST